MIVQIFSPVVASHRIMNCQFGNSYNSIKCENNLSIYFQEVNSDFILSKLTIKLSNVWMMIIKRKNEKKLIR